MMQIPAFYSHPTTQVVLVGFTAFCTVGMFSAVSNLGAGGTQDVALSDTANGVLYGCFAIMGLFSGGVNNVLGPRLTIFIGTLGYALYVGSLWCFQTQGTRWFLILAGALLGVSAALFWSAQGSIMMSYPMEKDKGKAFGIFWAIFQAGSFIGSLIALGININSGSLKAVATSTYIAFLIIILVGIASTWLLLPPNRVIRGDGTLVKVEAASNTKDEIRALFQTMKDWRMLALMPMFFASNYFYAYQGAVNAGKFTAPTRALNAVLEGAGAIVGALLIGFLVLDNPKFKRRTRGWLGLGVVTVLTIVVWSCGLAFQVTFSRKNPGEMIHYKEHVYDAKGTLFFFYFFSDATYQAMVYWIMGALTNDPFTLARFTGLYKAVQSAGAAGSFGMDAVYTPYLNEHLASWILILVSLPLAALVIRTIKDTSYEDEQVVYVDDIKAEHAEKADKEKDEKDDLSVQSQPHPQQA